MIHAVSLVLALALLAGTAEGAAAASPWAGRTVLVTGANRGLGLELARQLHAAGATVIGTAREPDAAAELAALGVRVEQLDVTDAASVAALADRLGDLPLDALLNNAGRYGQHGGFAGFDPDDALLTFEVNCLGAMRVTRALLPNLRRGGGKLVMTMSTGMASIAETGGGSVGYRVSKAGLNMFTATLATELRGEGFICVAVSPGWVRTDMGGEAAPLAPAESVRDILAVLAGLEPGDSGRFLDHDGRGLPW